jgi:hypothetical protein
MTDQQNIGIEAKIVSETDDVRSKILELVYSVPEDWQENAVKYLNKNYPEAFEHFSRAYGPNIIADFENRKPGTKLADLVYWIPHRNLENVYTSFNSMFPEDVRLSPERRIRLHFTTEKIDWTDRESYGRLY